MKGLLNAKDQVSKGVQLSKPIEEMNVFPPMITHMVRIGEDTGQLEPILENVADFYDSEVETAVSQLTTMLEPLIIVFLAVVVGFVVISIIQPMFQMYDGVGNV
jgi:type IV pilus assembly protein PilC